MSLIIKDLKFAFGLPFDEAVKYFESKGVAPSDSLEETIKLVQKNTFVITNMLKAGILKDIKEDIDKAIKGKLSLKEFKENFLKLLDKNGWLQEGGKTAVDSNWRMNLIYRQNVRNSYAEGRREQMTANIALMPYLQSFAVIDSRTRKESIWYDKKVFSVSDKTYLKYGSVMRDYNDRDREVPLSEFQKKRQGLKVTKGSSIPAKYKNKGGFIKNPSGVLEIDKSQYPPELRKKL